MDFERWGSAATHLRKHRDSPTGEGKTRSEEGNRRDGVFWGGKKGQAASRLQHGHEHHNTLQGINVTDQTRGSREKKQKRSTQTWEAKEELCRTRRLDAARLGK